MNLTVNAVQSDTGYWQGALFLDAEEVWRDTASSYATSDEARKAVRRRVVLALRKAITDSHD